MLTPTCADGVISSNLGQIIVTKSIQNVVTVVMNVWSTLSAEYGSTGYRCQSCSWSAEQDICFPCPRSRLRNWSREIGSAVPSLVGPLIFHTQAESDWLMVLTHGIAPAFRDGVHTYHQPPSRQCRVNRVAQLRTDGVHRRKSAGTGPEVVRGTGAAFSGVTMDQILCASLFRTPTIIGMRTCATKKISQVYFDRKVLYVDGERWCNACIAVQARVCTWKTRCCAWTR